MTKKKSRILAEKIRDIILSKKGENIVILDLGKFSSITDYFIIATGNNQPHIKAIANEVQQVLHKEDNIKFYNNVGTPESEWMIVDYIDVIVHIFSERTRNYYDLESLWNDAPRIRGGTRCRTSAVINKRKKRTKNS